jgi:peptidoglycan hydrolase-like protein with peptidoglycan-binding domain
MSGEPELAFGDSNEWVGYLQQLLEHNGHPVTVDSQFGDRTKHALLVFQKEQGLPETGDADSHTWAKLTGEA